MPEVLVGFSGWTYAPWRGVFYPAKLAQKRELEYASRKVNSIEINGTFYRLQKPRTFQQWYEQTPPDFKFALKTSQFITHRRRLQDVEQPLANFFAQGILCLREKLGPILWQFPPSLPLVDERFEDFIKLLSRSSSPMPARKPSTSRSRPPTSSTLGCTARTPRSRMAIPRTSLKTLRRTSGSGRRPGLPSTSTSTTTRRRMPPVMPCAFRRS